MVDKVQEIYKGLIAASVSIVFIVAFLFSLFHLTHKMDMTGMSDCPFMSHQETICPMSLFDHITAWKTVYVSVTPSLIFVSAIFLIASIAPNLLFKPLVLKSTFIKQRLREKFDRFYSRFLQELFSAGVLHAKVF